MTSHTYEEKRIGDTLFLNPGSCGPRRFRLPVTMAVLTFCPKEHRLEAERVDCLPEAVGDVMLPVFPARDMDRLVRRIIKEMKAGKGIPEIQAG